MTLNDFLIEEIAFNGDICAMRYNPSKQQFDILGNITLDSSTKKVNEDWANLEISSIEIAENKMILLELK